MLRSCIQRYRNGYISREEGIDLVKQYDHIVSSDLDYWLNYVDMDEEEFWKIADSFRDDSTWRIEGWFWV